MKFEAKDKVELNKIGVSSLLDLALVLPKSFEDTTITKAPKNGQVCINVKLNIINKTNKGMILATAFAYEWGCDVKIVIFNAKGWHFSVFTSGKEATITGICSFAYNNWQITNPKIITKTDQIIPKFKTDLKDEKVKNLIEKYINKENLLSCGLNNKESDFLLSIQENSQKSIAMLEDIKKGELESDILKFIEIFNYIKKLDTKKTYFENKKIELFEIKDWIKNLPFKPTTDQINAINDIRQDLLSKQAKRRVVMGDVGSGKTLVMLASALGVYPNKAILMAPTSILADQIYNEAIKLLPNFISTKLVKSGEKNINFDDTNLIIGTHVLLYQELPKAVLVMIDEQHRFGSNQRNKIEEMVKDGETRATFIQFSATPIPRTLSLIQSSLVNFSFLKQMPFEKNIHSQVLQNNDFNNLLSHIKKQIEKNKQIIIVYPLVESSETSNYQSLNEAKDFWIKNFKNVYFTHGKDKEKEKILNEFRENGNILLSTTVVEVGISLPRLSTILIVGAERLGLATLHQLRGRVGRNGGNGFCFLYTKLKNPPERLKEFCDTLDGFKIAEIDLKNRQSGDILNGTVQHGATFLYYNYEENITQLALKRLGKTN
ncbi:ATP-dependent DNA helicase RecG [Campylobacter pinnipediorum]|uniref:ATP-dependent DNA helicase RecG n=1 Tax=Campylobacter pinnipediorum TaxID=1965231 RepID=UPI00084D0872|nr:ATP-dependent DNA helicase RecG [Campylobacter pinnipediorum]